MLRQVWRQFSRLVAASHRQMPLSPELVLHGIEPEGSSLPPGLTALHLILWKFVILHFTLVDTENAKFIPDAVWSMALRRFEVRVNALAAKVRSQAIRRRGQGFELLSPNADNRRLAPLASLASWGNRTISAGLAKVFSDSRPAVPT